MASFSPALGGDWARYEQRLCYARIVKIGAAIWKWDAIIRCVHYESVFVETKVFEFLKDEPDSLIHATNGLVLCSQVSPCCWRILNKVWHIYIVDIIINWVPIWNRPHSWTSISKFFTEHSKLRVSVVAAMWVMKTNVQKERAITCLAEKLSHEILDKSDIASHLINGVILFRVGEIKRVHRLRTDVLLSNDSCPKSPGLLQDQRQALHLIKRLEMVIGMVQAVHPVFVVRNSCKNGGTTRGAAAHCGESVVENERLFRKFVQIRRLAFVVSVDGCLEARIVGYDQQNVFPVPRI